MTGQVGTELGRQVPLPALGGFAAASDGSNNVYFAKAPSTSMAVHQPFSAVPTR
jgi:hypothetical protein